ncbi:uncharacterized protein MONBRDRAFT_32351 [Monosiga brevicollis MX1]|uniref:ELMO domain-containing protein n=1 Tax=Monosiga brevicollis TaxID=81824 RepID=A9UYZ1_MONBE|nr:uncharacterized protein MONBRDRAFT_32351 [Monosiga brevicollis MX1]EDQ89543.1 predicted protein [Monosiga brevicollis MX1]|eukprot:XP_001745572.1 hypothetical protein [Monosiga brevicollis MX1]
MLDIYSVLTVGALGAGAMFYAYYVNQQAAGPVSAQATPKPFPKAKRTTRAQSGLTALRARAKIAYDDSNADHQRLLQRLWTAMRPNQPYPGALSLAWRDLGFQGEEPATDFRGMGLLGLDALVYAAEHHQADLIDRINRPNDDVFFYFFAIGGINIAETILRLLEDEAALANAVLDREADAATCFGRVVVDAWLQFDQVFILYIQQFLADGNPPELTIMQFEQARQRFEAHYRDRMATLVADGGETLSILLAG